VQSDSASILPFTQAVLDLDGVRFMRDPTRGGLATVLCEIQQATTLGIRVQEAKIPIRAAVKSYCEMLGYDPLYLACEGRVLAVVAAERIDDVLARWRALPAGADAQCIGYLADDCDRVLLQTEWGGERVLQELEDDPLPRIC
jgi:hydrogenase expression/formation protein HypE